jgi:hypothetical protein
MANRLVRRLPYPTLLPHGEREPRTVSLVVNNAVEGNLNVVGELQFLAGTTTTRLEDPRISNQSFFAWQALDAAGAALIPSIWYKTRGVRFAEFGHSAPAADLWLEFAVFG